MIPDFLKELIQPSEENRENIRQWRDLFLEKKQQKRKEMQPIMEKVPKETSDNGYSDYEDSVKNLYRDQLGTAVRENTDINEYYPVMNELSYMYDKGSVREGLPELLALQALFESTGGRASNNNNLFGALPRGEGGEPASFGNLSESIDYQLSENVLGGGANPNMNILAGEGRITEDEIKKLYESYNPSGDYLDLLLEYYRSL